MRGKTDRQAVLFVASIDLEARVRPDHPLRAIKRMADQDLAKMSRRFDTAYAQEGRPSVPPERLIKAMLLQSLYSIRSEAQLVERIDHDLLFRWFLDLRIDELVFDATVFSHNRVRLEKHGLIDAFFNSTVRRAIAIGLVSSDHFSVDGSLIEAYASIKSFKSKDRDDSGDSNGFKGRNAEVDFHGQKRSNDTHESTTDPDAKLIRKSDGQPARLAHALHAIVENRHGLVLAVEVNSPLDNSEPKTAVSLLDRVKERFKITPKTLGADKGYDQGPFLLDLEKRKITPHVATKDGPIGGEPGTRYSKVNTETIAARKRMRKRESGVGYSISQRCRKKIEECFGWVKTIGGLARTRLIGHRKTGQQAHIAAAAFNLIRLRSLSGVA
ncbi:IS5 family transposase [Humisphaera borealis]|uniref:IS5 family transposase n=1 Tax=Humisphaera borealis TaxID=2807512 RepID=A0A7M2WW73_9BACT|nr:IS5 family transposase [Humisphaera borealis]QOV89716.1 IS5 family transposase [Humisphaera borealis]QOV89775.1 IS5 family transposase [Humisphaera borealis]